ncbi:alpha-mannosidase [Microbacterium terricola]|uniref:Glycosyl hydrolase n=1 Tax=Microbacterium terricola TaxID=344163 RepID=A0ABM8E346_9MICO|nr:glycoside hydrolase family 38 C-terminal domain-containing protein [Microbacterium terricola]UYK39928.1 glycosyl hydrolase-related protein [Microbacterium terricola]BDV32393.1 putative glycosyl hydrolase [Microbacterium terricola]
MPGLIAELGGYALRQPREYSRLRRIRDAIYTVVAPLRAEVLRSDEPIAFAEIDRGGFRPLRDGTAWGAKFDCAWLRITGEVPAGASDVVVMLGIRGEGLVYSAAGDVLDSVSTVWIQGDLPHAGGQHRPVHGVDTSTGRIEFYADVAYNGWLLYDYGKAKFHGAHLARRDDVVFGLYYDYLTLAVLADATADPALAADLKAALRAAYGHFTAGDARAARGALAGPLAAASDSDFVYSAVGHGHLDMAWLWPLRETRRKAARTYANALKNIDRTDDYIYGTSQPQQMQWMKQEHPALFERMKDAVAAGRMELQGAFWVEPDTNLPSGESLVRQALHGRRFLEEEFGLGREDMRLCWLPDTFGYNGNLPQILRKSGMDWFQTIKLSWNKVNVFPHRTFHWQGIDGSTVLVHMPPEGDYNSRGAADGLLKGVRQYQERDLGSALLVYGAGDGGGGPGEVHLEVTRREQDLRGLPRVEYSTADRFFRALEQRDIAHTHVGELYLETHQGTYTTQGAIKKYNRLVERKLHNAEALTALTGGGTDALDAHWKALLLNQFHDIIPGSSITRVNTEAVETYQEIDHALDAHIGELSGRLTTGDGPSAINLTGFARREFVKTGDEWMHAEVGPYAASVLHPAPPTPELAYTADTLTNGVLTLRFDATGEIVSCTDAAGREHAGAGLNRLIVFSDPFQFPFDAWDIDQKYRDLPSTVLTASEVRTAIEGPTVVRYQVYRTPKVTIHQRVILDAESAVVRFETHVDWHEKHRMLRAEFFPSHYGPEALCEIQFGHIGRPTTERDSVEKAQFEICAHKWIAVQDDEAGFALLNDSKYGHRAKDGLLSLNLLRSPTFPDKTADRGAHEFTYAFTPFAAGDLAGVIAEGYRLNNPLLVAEGVAFESAVETAGDAVIVETLKRAEDGSGIIVRLYESLGRPATTALHTTIAHRRAVETDLMERPAGEVDLSSLAFGPFEIKTILLEN